MVKSKLSLIYTCVQTLSDFLFLFKKLKKERSFLRPMQWANNQSQNRFSVKVMREKKTRIHKSHSTHFTRQFYERAQHFNAVSMYVVRVCGNYWLPLKVIGTNMRVKSFPLLRRMFLCLYYKLETLCVCVHTELITLT